MKTQQIKNYLGAHLVNMRGWNTNRKIVVFESDDWGSIRMPSKQVHEALTLSGINLGNCAYNCNDSLESSADLNALFTVLTKFKDQSGRKPIFTANTVVANPDFEKIKDSGFDKYFLEPFTKTLLKYSPNDKTFDVWKQGINENLFYPQFHGREHVNVALWMRLLRNNNLIFRKAFDAGLWGLGPEILNVDKINIQASFDALDKKELVFQQYAIKEGLDLFEKIFKFRSKSYIANNFVWDLSLNEALFENGIRFLQGMKYQKLPYFYGSKRKMIYHYTGQKNQFGQTYLVRNCSFEPTLFKNQDNVSACLKDISKAFFWKKPAIITTHRLNYIGSIVENNRKANLNSLNKLLSEIITMWPNVEFLTTVELGEIINH